MVGTELLHYHIDAKLGEGGMGEVFQATDTRLGRSVAIKVLPDAFAQNPGRLALFEREARALAALNHPHVAAIYGIEESDARRVIRVWLLGGEWVPGQPTFGCLKFRAALSRG